MKTTAIPHTLRRAALAMFVFTGSAIAHPGHPGHNGVTSTPADFVPSHPGLEHISLAVTVAVLALLASRGVFRNLP